MEELENLCEELQKRLVDVRSGREVDGLRRRLAAASELAERQDELLEETSARLETLQNECRCNFYQLRWSTRLVLLSEDGSRVLCFCVPFGSKSFSCYIPIHLYPWMSHVQVILVFCALHPLLNPLTEIV